MIYPINIKKKIKESRHLKENVRSVASVAAWLKDSIEAMTANQELTISRRILDSNFGFYVYWTQGFDIDDESVIHADADKSYGLVAALKCRNDAEWDGEYMDSPYDPKTGDLYCEDYELSPKDNTKMVAEWLLEDYNSMIELINNNPEIVIGGLKESKSVKEGMNWTNGEEEYEIASTLANAPINSVIFIKKSYGGKNRTFKFEKISTDKWDSLNKFNDRTGSYESDKSLKDKYIDGATWKLEKAVNESKSIKEGIDNEWRKHFQTTISSTDIKNVLTDELEYYTKKYSEYPYSLSQESYYGCRIAFNIIYKIAESQSSFTLGEVLCLIMKEAEEKHQEEYNPDTKDYLYSFFRLIFTELQKKYGKKVYDVALSQGVSREIEFVKNYIGDTSESKSIKEAPDADGILYDYEVGAKYNDIANAEMKQNAEYRKKIRELKAEISKLVPEVQKIINILRESGKTYYDLKVPYKGFALRNARAEAQIYTNSKYNSNKVPAGSTYLIISKDDGSDERVACSTAVTENGEIIVDWKQGSWTSFSMRDPGYATVKALETFLDYFDAVKEKFYSEFNKTVESKSIKEGLSTKEILEQAKKLLEK